MVTAPTTTGVDVAVRALAHAFDLGGERLDVLADIDLRVGPGEFVVLLGPSGSGKSTLLRLLAGLDRPSSGSVVVDGEVVTAPSPSRAVVFQDPTLLPWRSVRRNVAFGPESTGTGDVDRRVAAALDLVDLAGFADAHPHQLSGGMAQRVALARALVNDPPLLLLDEPLGKLDALTRLQLQRVLLDLWRRARFTALLVTHDVDEALQLATRVIVLSARPGRIVADIPIDAEHPREHADPQILALRRQILELLGFGAFS